MSALPHLVVICLCCSLVYTRQRLTEKSLSNFYQNLYQQLDRGRDLPKEEYFRLESKKGQDIFHYMFNNSLLPPKNTLIVEIGCGVGGVLYPFRKYGYEIIGCDFNQDYINFGITTRGLNLKAGGLKEISKVLFKSKKKVGLVIYEQVFEHLPDPKKELTQLKKIMTSNTLLYLGVPGIKNIRHHYQENFRAFLQFPHLTYFELSTLKSLLASQGFQLLKGTERIRGVFKLGQKRNILLTNPDGIITYIQNLKFI